MKPREVGFAGVGRRDEETPADIVCPTADLGLSRIAREQNLGERLQLTHPNSRSSHHTGRSSPGTKRENSG